MKSILLADDHPMTLNGIQLFVENLGYHVVETHQDGLQAFQGIVKNTPDFAILDLNMPGMNGLEVLAKLRETNIVTKIIIYTMYREKSFFDRAKALNVNGYLLKDFAIEELECCLEKINANETWFSPKLMGTLLVNKHDGVSAKINSLTASEKKILSLIAEDHSTKTIAELLFISEKTVESHRTNIINKLGLPKNERNVLLRFALQNRGS